MTSGPGQRKDIFAYLINSTPKYYYILPLHVQLVRRYAGFDVDIVLATEVPDHPICQQLAGQYKVELLQLNATDTGFLDSRRAALAALAHRYTYVLPVQEDFLLDRAPPLTALQHCIKILEDTPAVASIRLMPSPAPAGPAFDDRLTTIAQATDTYGFTFQATLWRLVDCLTWYTALCDKLEAEWPRATTRPEKRIQVETRVNFAENADGQRFFWKLFSSRIHLGWRRAGPWRNAVYLCPWPYRPTAIVQGRLEPFAKELGEREGLPLLPLSS